MVTTSHLSPQEGATMVMRPQAQTIPQVRGSMCSCQDSLAATPMSVSMEVRWMDVLAILLFLLTIDYLLGMNSAFCQSFFLPLFVFLAYRFIVFSPFVDLFFYRSSSFSFLFCSFFSSCDFISSLS
jgi:hypothetical protein